ncbi:hypothetical protein ACFOGI_11190 [Virgibacillus xinjiangensis]|uniref:Uncharacterized protein n=1 Tax=Virgibacillus xinjiangensis TaxID=393090 RepID=A0ABV7CWS9_9BACI
MKSAEASRYRQHTREIGRSGGISAGHVGNRPKREDIGSTRRKSAGARGYQQHTQEIGWSARISAAHA